MAIILAKQPARTVNSSTFDSTKGLTLPSSIESVRTMGSMRLGLGGLGSQRSSKEHESTRRLKTEFLVQFDGATSGREGERITVMGATNRPKDLDEAARRRLTKRIYVPLPEPIARAKLIYNLLRVERHNLNDKDLITLSDRTIGFSGNDLSNLCVDAAMGPLRDDDIDIEEMPSTQFVLSLCKISKIH